MNNKERLELAKWVILRAQKRGAKDAAVNVYMSRDIEVEYRTKQIDKLTEATENSLNLSVYADHRYSSHSTNDLDKKALGKFIDEAVLMTKYLSEDKYRALPDPKYYEGKKEIDLHIFDPDYESVTSENRVRLAREMEATALGISEKVVACTSYYNDSYNESTKVHSNGFEGSRRATSFSVGIEVTVCDEKECRPNDFDFRTVRYFNNLPDHELIARKAVERAFSKIGQQKLDSGKYDMIVENRARASLLGALYKPMQARSIQQKRSCFKGKLGQKVASEKLTLIDDPFVEYGLGSKLYDGEGMAAKRRVMIEKGVLKSFYTNCYYGNKLNWEPTTGGSTNLVFEYGSKSLDELLTQMKKGILVTGFIGGNSNSTTGDFSFGIIGKYVEDGKIIKPIYEMNISGNIIELWNKLIEVGNDPYTFSSWRRPSMYFKDVDFSGV
ncbi:MAG: TldD/PmbA family protein [Candidatus Zixiibacteriota bacterium]|nr:MAG: TldD/PmbA family protein [candidate division Zixibacteria bacterium]